VIRRDYILRMIQDFMALLARLNSLKQGQLWTDAGALLDEEFMRLVKSGSKSAASLSETELLARVITGEPTMVVREKTLMLARLLKEAGDLAAIAKDSAESRSCYLKGLHLLLQTLASGEAFDWPDFVPNVETFLARLEDHGPLPLATLAMLMQHYEIVGEFGRAEDMLFTMLDSDLRNAGVLELGESFYRRIGHKSDAALQLGNLPRAELQSGLEEFRRRAGRQSYGTT
jgi:hypothetical protein